MARLRRALGEYMAAGIKTNVGLFRRILDSHDFQNAAIYTRWLDDFLREPASEAPPSEAEEDAAALAAALWQESRQNAATGGHRREAGGAESRWKSEGRREQVERDPRV
jgi:acetyl-CoA carboxylase biotin carboxylase subunit